MSINDIVHILLAILFLTLGVAVFRYASSIKLTKEEYAKYMYYGGLLLFINAGLLVYISDVKINIVLSVLCMGGCIGLALYGKRK